MTFTISYGWWIAPAVVTASLCVVCWLKAPRMQPQNGSMFPDLGGALMNGLCWAAAIIVSLVAWLIWALAA